MALESTITTRNLTAGGGRIHPLLIEARRRKPMGANENAATIRRGYEAFNRGDMNTLTELFDENASWHTPGRSKLANDYKGRDAVFAYFGRLGQETAGNFKADLQHLLADDGG